MQNKVSILHLKAGSPSAGIQHWGACRYDAFDGFAEEEAEVEIVDDGMQQLRAFLYTVAERFAEGWRASPAL